MRLAVLDDYQDYSAKWPGWRAFDGIEVVSFRDHLEDEDALAERLAAFDAVMRIRERTAFPRTLLERLPRLEELHRVHRVRPLPRSSSLPKAS